MDHFAGLDVSVKETSVCIVDDTGKIVREVKVATEPEALLAVLKNPAYHFKRIGLEAGPLSQWLFSALAEAELPVVCVETRHMQAVLKAQINKTDRNDARGVAQMMRVGLYRPVHVKTLRSQKLRMLLTQRQLLQSNDVAWCGEFFRSRRLELERTFGRIGGHRHRRLRQRMFQLWIGEVGNALKDREVGHDCKRKACEHDRFAADLVGEPAEQDEARRADRERDRDHDLRADTGNLESLRQEEQRIELAAIPHHGFAGGGAEKCQDRNFQVVPLAEGFQEWPSRLLTLLDHAPEQRRFIKLEPDPERDCEQDRRQ